MGFSDTQGILLLALKRLRGKELSFHYQGKIVGRQEAGESQGEIVAATRLSQMAIRYNLVTIQVRDEGKSLSRSSTLVIYDSRSRRRMLICLRFYLKMTYKQRREHIGLKMSDSIKRDEVPRGNWEASDNIDSILVRVAEGTELSPDELCYIEEIPSQ